MTIIINIENGTSLYQQKRLFAIMRQACFIVGMFV
nr:MAG TPA: hypothetical protein [Caudoviricetes sp.]